MLKHVLTFCMSVWIIGVSGVLAQADLTGAITSIRAEKFSEAKQELEEFLSVKQKNTDQIYYWLGYISYQQEAYAKAKAYFEQSVGTKSKSPYGNAGLGVIALKEDKLADANEYLDLAKIANKGKDIEAEFAIAESYLQGGTSEIQNAKIILYGTRDKAPDNPRSYILLGEYYKKQGVLELAIEELEKAISKAPDYIPAYVYLAELYFEQGKETKNSEDFNKGFSYAQQAIKKNPEYAPAYRIRGELYLLLKEYQKARDDLQKYVSLAGNDRRARIRYASFLFLAEDYEEALKELNSIDTTTNVMRRLKGIAYNKMGQNDKALESMDDYFKNVKKEEYIIWQDYEVMGNIYRDKGDLDKADEFYGKMIMKNTDRAVVYEDLAEDYNTAAKAIKSEASKTYKADKAALQASVQAAFEKYNECAKAGDVPCTEEQQAIMDKAKADAPMLQVNREKAYASAIPVFALEAHYREKALDIADPVGLQNYYKMGLAQYFAENWEGADASFKEVHKIKADYVTPYNYRLRIANMLEAKDTTTQDWFAKTVAEDIIGVWGEETVADLDKKESEILLVAYVIMANYSFNPTGGTDNYNCADAIPWVEKIYTINPDYEQIKSLVNYCESVGQGPSGR